MNTIEYIHNNVFNLCVAHLAKRRTSDLNVTGSPVLLLFKAGTWSQKTDRNQTTVHYGDRFRPWLKRAIRNSPNGQNNRTERLVGIKYQWFINP